MKASKEGKGKEECISF